MASATERLHSHAEEFMKHFASRHELDGDEDAEIQQHALRALDSLQNDNQANQKKNISRVSISWRQLNYSVETGSGGCCRRRKVTKVILNNVSGSVDAGRLLAVMGPTGCGKTSLINALAARLPKGGKLTGSILVNGKLRTKGFRNISAYVMQDDVLFSNLTVRETLLIAAQLRLPSASVDHDTKERIVDDVILELGLAKAANTWIGNDLIRGVSGGERKRVNIGVEMMSNPSIVFLDEPTSGLDAFQAQNVMQSLWSLAQKGRTVLCTIHQPRSSIYSMFDLLVLLSEGRTMFYGMAVEAVGYFANLGFSCPEHFNPSDFFLDVISVDYRSKAQEAASQERLTSLADVFNQHEQQQLQQALSAKTAGGTSSADLDGKGLGEFNFANNWIQQFAVLSRRAFTQNSRDLLPLVFAGVLTCFIGLVLGLLYSNIKLNQQGIQDRAGILFFVTLFALFSNVQPVLAVFPTEQRVVRRERAAKSYRVAPYYISKIISEAPIRTFSSLLFASIVYWLVGLNPGAKQFFTFFAMVFLLGSVAQAFGIMISAAVPTEKLATAISPAILVVCMLFGGFYINQESMPAWLAWFRYLDFLYWGFMALMINEFRGRCCFACGQQCLAVNAQGVCTQYGQQPAVGCLSTGNEVLVRFGYSQYPLWAGFVGCLVCFVIFHLLGYLLLRFRQTKFMSLQQSSAAHTGAQQATEGDQQQGMVSGTSGGVEMTLGKVGGSSVGEEAGVKEENGGGVELMV